MRAVHFGGGNIGRGFIGQVLFENDIAVTFVDVNEDIINALNDRQTYQIHLADTDEEVVISNVSGINNGQHPEAVVSAIAEADIVTTAIGPKILPFIAPLIAEGLEKRAENEAGPIDVIACENMIGGSDFLRDEVLKSISETGRSYLENNVGFPNAAVDRIVPLQSHKEPLYVSVEAYREWVIDESGIKNKALILDGVHYVADLEPYIERKLFTVNTGHATVAYEGAAKDYQTILEAITDPEIEKQLRGVLAETGNLMVMKWSFEPEAHQDYIEKIITRFKNKHIIDDITRVARTPIRKLGYQERFIQPLRELKELSGDYSHLLETIGKIFQYNDPKDEESVMLQSQLTKLGVTETIKEVTGLTDEALVNEIASQLKK